MVKWNHNEKHVLGKYYTIRLTHQQIKDVVTILIDRRDFDDPDDDKLFEFCKILENAKEVPNPYREYLDKIGGKK